MKMKEKSRLSVLTVFEDLKSYCSRNFLKRVFKLVKKIDETTERETETFLNFLDLVWKGF